VLLDFFRSLLRERLITSEMQPDSRWRCGVVEIEGSYRFLDIATQGVQIIHLREDGLGQAFRHVAPSPS
jgi:hypothetical protein